jgi:hypothetical protein
MAAKKIESTGKRIKLTAPRRRRHEGSRPCVPTKRSTSIAAQRKPPDSIHSRPIPTTQITFYVANQALERARFPVPQCRIPRKVCLMGDLEQKTAPTVVDLKSHRRQRCASVRLLFCAPHSAVRCEIARPHRRRKRRSVHRIIQTH